MKNESIEKYLDSSPQISRRDLLRRCAVAATEKVVLGFVTVDLLSGFSKALLMFLPIDNLFPIDKEADELVEVEKIFNKTRRYPFGKIYSSEIQNLDPLEQRYIQAQSSYNKIWDQRIKYQREQTSQLDVPLLRNLIESMFLFFSKGVLSLNHGYRFSDLCYGLMEEKEGFKRLIRQYRPHWLTQPPSQEEFNEITTSLLYLPPIGGKIDIPGKKGPIRNKAVVSLTSEAHLLKIDQLRKRANAKDEFIHQLSVQGRMPDEFKYAALALIISTPGFHDWQTPFYEADWGKIAPLIHDGGVVDTKVNPFYKYIAGRTDFLRVFKVFEPELENMEGLSIQQIVNLPEEKIKAGLREQMLKSYLRLSVNFYQRAALYFNGLHYTSHIQVDMLASIIGNWRKFIQEMDNLFEDYQIAELTNVPWFLDKPRDLGWRFGLRYEADWPPIQRRLIQLEETRTENPEICARTIQIMKQFVSEIDQSIGLS